MVESRGFLPQTSKAGGAEVRAVQNADGSARLSGYAIRWDTLSVPLPSRFRGVFREKISRGSIANLRDGDILCCYDHQLGNLLGRTSSGTLVLNDDPTGLAFSVSIPDTSLGRDVLQLVKRGDLRGMSFSFNILDGGETWSGDIRTITAMRVSEISIVATPAYQSTEVAARSIIPADSPLAGKAAELDLVVKQLQQERVEDELWREQRSGYDYDAT